MTSTQYITNMARTFVSAELFMAAANSGGSVAARMQAETLLDDYFALVEEVVPRTEHNPLDCRA
jgi:hypothetical protein